MLVKMPAPYFPKEFPIRKNTPMGDAFITIPISEKIISLDAWKKFFMIDRLWSFFIFRMATPRKMEIISVWMILPSVKDLKILVENRLFKNPAKVRLAAPPVISCCAAHLPQLIPRCRQRWWSPHNRQ